MSILILMCPLLLVCCGGLALLIIDAFSKEESGLSTLSSVIFLAAGGVALYSSFEYASMAVLIQALPETFTRYLAFDRMSYVSDALICFASAICALMAGVYLKQHKLERGEFYGVLIFASFGAMVLAKATDLLTVFIGLETMSLGTYALVAFRRSNLQSIEGGMKYFLMGSFASAILLFGIALLYGATGSTSFHDILLSVQSAEAHIGLFALATMMIVVGLAFKMSAVPFHAWTPDAYEGAVTPVTAWMAAAVKAAVFVIAIRILVGVFRDPQSTSLGAGWPPVVVVLSLLSMVYGNFCAISQRSVKRMLAYSSIAHAGYLMLGLAASPFNPTGAYFSPVVFYLIAYAVSTVLTFGSLIWMGSSGDEVVHYEDLNGLGRRYPMVALPMVIGILSLLGFPPTAGFFAKYTVFSVAVSLGGRFLWLAVIGVLTTVVSAYFYLRVLVHLWMKEREEGQPLVHPTRDPLLGFALAVCSIVVLQLGMLPSKVLRLTEEVAQSLIKQSQRK